MTEPFHVYRIAAPSGFRFPAFKATPAQAAERLEKEKRVYPLTLHLEARSPEGEWFAVSS